jgi:cell division protease FtsH
MEEKKKVDEKRNYRLKSLLTWLIVIGLFYFFWRANVDVALNQVELKYSEFYQMLRDDPSQIVSAVKTDTLIRGQLKDGTYFRVIIPEEDQDLIKLMREKLTDFEIKPPRTLWINLLFSLGPILLFMLFLWYFGYRGAQGGAKIFSFGKARARLITGDQQKVTFDDVAGVDEAKEELKEIIEFLKDPKKFQRLGGKIPKGVLLTGPPGTGKTLLAKAVSGEAGVPFFSISGSDFVEMFVGIGAARVRDLFEQAKKYARTTGKGCIIFIDEIDAVGRQRFAGIGGGHDEREQTLNALLVEMDGFDTEEGIIVMAATNRPDVLDPALLRPGRFDRQIVIDSPDLKGREEILKVHVRNKKLAPDVDLKKIARQTPGFSGADLANLCNEAALLAARRGKDAITMEEMEEAIERVMAGPQRKSRVMSDYEKKVIAFHEAGHALLSLIVPKADPLHKVSIIPRGVAALGYTMQVPLQDRYIVTKGELMAKLIVLLGGRASEELALGERTTGAQNDLELATEIARKMVCEFGMSENLGNISFQKRSGPVFLGRDLVTEKHYSETTAVMIDKEVKVIIHPCYHSAKELLEQNREKLYLLANTLLEREVLDGDEVRKLLGLEEKKDSQTDDKSQGP